MPDKKISRYNNVEFKREGTKLWLGIELDEVKVDAGVSKKGTSVVVSVAKRAVKFNELPYFLNLVFVRMLSEREDNVEL